MILSIQAARIAALIFLIFSYTQVSANDFTQYGRYLTAEHPAKPTDTLLNTTVQREFPEHVQTLGEALNYTLQGTGYSLLSNKQSAPEVQQLFQHNLPDHKRRLPPMKLSTALLTLAGPAYQIVLDPVHRMITFKLRKHYETL